MSFEQSISKRREQGLSDHVESAAEFLQYNLLYQYAFNPSRSKDPMNHPIFNAYLRIVTEFPKAVLLIIALITLGLAAGLPNFKLDASADSLTLENDRDLDYFRQTSKNYSSGDFLVVTFRPEKDLFSDKSLDLLAEVKKDLSQVEGVVGINSILDVPLLYSPKQGLTEIVKEPRYLMTPGMDRKLAKKEFLESPIYKNLILGPDGQTTAIQISLRVDTQYISLVERRDQLRFLSRSSEFTAEQQSELDRVSKEFLDHRTQAEAKSRKRVQQVRGIVDKYKGDAEIFVGGISMITADMIAFIQSDLVVFGVAVVVFMILVLAVIFRSLRFVVIPMTCCLTAVLMMLGYVSWLDWRLTVISSNFVALLLIVSLAIIIHLIVRYREFLQDNPGWSRKQLASETVKFMFLPCFYTALTTMVAFASLVVSGIRPVIDFGWMMTIGLVVALSLAFLVLPALLVILPKTKASEGHTKKVERKPLTLYFSRVVEHHGKVILACSFIVAALSIWGITRLEVENRFIDYFHKSTEIYQGLSVIDENLGGTTSLDIVIGASQEELASISGYIPEDAGDDPFASEDVFAESDEDPFASEADDPFGDGGTQESSEPENYWMSVNGLKRVEKLHDYLESLPEVGKVESLAILYKVGKDINGGLNDFELAVLQKNVPAQVRSVLINPYLANKGNQTRVSMRIHDAYPNLKRAELVERIKAHIDQDPTFDTENVRFTGLLVLYNNMLASLFHSQIVTLGVVFLGIFIMFLILFRSIKVSLVAISPTVLAACFVLGAMGLMGLPLDMMTITVAAISVGIGVDNAIHYIHRFKKELAKTGDYIDSMHRSHTSIGKAMFYTSVIIVIGFGIMVLSKFIPTIYFGLLTGLAMFAALLGALLLLPKLIILFKPFGKPNKTMA